METREDFRERNIFVVSEHGDITKRYHTVLGQNGDTLLSLERLDDERILAGGEETIESRLA